MRYDNELMAQSPASRSVRLIFEYDGDQIRLVSRQEVDVEPPATDPTTAPAEQTGFWAEVRDSNLHVLHRQVMHDPAMTHPEVFSNEPGKTIARAATPVRKGAFTLLVPAIAASDHVALVRKAPETVSKAPALRVRTGEIARFSLTEEPAPEQKAKQKKKQSPAGARKKNPKEKRK